MDDLAPDDSTLAALLEERDEFIATLRRALLDAPPALRAALNAYETRAEQYAGLQRRLFGVGGLLVADAQVIAARIYDHYLHIGAPHGATPDGCDAWLTGRVQAVEAVAGAEAILRAGRDTPAVNTHPADTTTPWGDGHDA